MQRSSFRTLLPILLATGARLCIAEELHPAPDAFPEGVHEIRYTSAADNTEQPALFWKPEMEEKRPLLVALHTWSHDYRQEGNEIPYAEWCQAVGWVFIHPNFRGPNKTPEAMGSELAVGDILSAVDYAKENATIDEDRIYCIGVSGGGHASLLMAGRAPQLWAGVSAWCGISDIAAWHAECNGTKQQRYADNIEAAIDGPPDTPERLKEAQQRSPNTWLNSANGVSLDIIHGVHDGRTGGVPFTHSLHAWNEVTAPTDPQARFSDELIDSFYQSQESPEGDVEVDPLYPENQQPVFRRSSGNTRITIFEGGHEILHHPALNWLAAQRKGQPANWQPDVLHTLTANPSRQQSGK